MKKNFIPFIALAGIVLTGCGDKGASSNRLYALSYNLQDPNMSGLWKPGLENASVAEGFEKINLADAKNDDGEALKLLEAACIEDYAAYLINVVDHTNGKTYVNKVKETGKPAIFWNRLIDKEALKSYDKACYVGIEAAEGGRYQGAMAAEYINKVGFDKVDRNGDGKIGVLVIRGEKGHADAEARTKFSPMYLERNLTGGNKDANATVEGINYKAEGFKKVSVLGIVDGTDMSGATWSDTAAREAVEAKLVADTAKTIDIILSNNDGMALGILKGAEFDKLKLPIWGVDALDDALTEIKKADSALKGTVKNDGVAQAKVCVKVAKNLINGKALTEGLEVVTTKEAWEKAPNAVYHVEDEKQILVHHSKVTRENA